MTCRYLERGPFDHRPTDAGKGAFDQCPCRTTSGLGSFVGALRGFGVVVSVAARAVMAASLCIGPLDSGQKFGKLIAWVHARRPPVAIQLSWIASISNRR